MVDHVVVVNDNDWPKVEWKVGNRRSRPAGRESVNNVRYTLAWKVEGVDLPALELVNGLEEVS